LQDAKKIILVHNTFSREDDIKFATSNQSWSEKIFFCFCVNANQYIENTMPPVELFRKHNCKIVLGTDSLASNHSLSILDEMKTISEHFPDIPFEELLQWSTINGAKALEIDKVAGSFTQGNIPGVILIENTEGMKLVKQSSVRRIL